MAAEKGIDGVKLGAYPPDIMAALLDEARKLGLGSTAHLGQTGVAEMNAIDAARLGLGTVTHFYGIFESLYDDDDVQPVSVEADTLLIGEEIVPGQSLDSPSGNYSLYLENGGNIVLSDQETGESTTSYFPSETDLLCCESDGELCVTIRVCEFPI